MGRLEEKVFRLSGKNRSSDCDREESVAKFSYITKQLIAPHK